MLDAPSLPLPHSDGGGATLPSARQSDVLSLLAGDRRSPPSASSSCARDRARCGGPSCRPPLRPVLPRHLDGRSDLGLVCEVLHIAEGKQHMGELPRLVVEVLRLAAVEVSDGGKELGGVHDAPPNRATRWGFTSCHRPAPP